MDPPFIYVAAGGGCAVWPPSCRVCDRCCCQVRGGAPGVAVAVVEDDSIGGVDLTAVGRRGICRGDRGRVCGRGGN